MMRDVLYRVLNYRRPGFWITLAALIALVFVLVCFLTNPSGQIFDLDQEKVTAVFVQSGTTGEQYYFETEEEKEMVIQLLNDLRYDYSVPDLRPAMGGWSYRIVIETGEERYDCIFGFKSILLDDVFYCFREENETLALLREYADSDWATENWDFRGRCYNVIKGLQSQDSYHVTVEETYNCAHREETSHSTDYWRLRGEWLTVEEYPGRTVKTIQTGGRTYSTAQGEKWAVDEEKEWTSPFLYEFWWNGGIIDGYAHGQEGEIRYVTVQVNEALEMDGVTIPYYLLTFHFDLEWTPISVTQTASWTADGREESMEITTYLHTYDDVAVRSEIESHYLQAMEDLREISDEEMKEAVGTTLP